jgi:mono/diheme cytochrome c family protein
VILASSTQRAVAVVIVFAALAAWAVYLVLENKRSTSDIVDSFLDAPNRKQPPDDDVFEGRRLDRFLTAALVGTTALAVSLPLYWLGEPGREKGALIGFDKREIKRGMENYENVFACNKCHGPEGGGGVATWTVTDYDKSGQPIIDPATGKPQVRQVEWKAPRINNVALRYKPGQITNILNYGRGGAKNNPMPAWGTVGGGPGTPQQIADLVSLLSSWAIEGNPAAKEAYKKAWNSNGYNAPKAFAAAFEAAAKDAQAESAKALDDEKKNAATLVKGEAESRKANQKALDEAKASGNVVTIKAAETAVKDFEFNLANAKKTLASSDGEILFNQNCARCHTRGWSYNEPQESGGGFYGPTLKAASLITQFPDPAKQAEFIKLGAADEAAYGTAGVNHWSGGGMAYFGNVLSDDLINEIVKYERGLK